MKIALNSIAMTLADVAIEDQIQRGGNIAVAHIEDKKTSHDYIFIATSGVEKEELYKKHKEYSDVYNRGKNATFIYSADLDEDILEEFPIERSNEEGTGKDIITPNITFPNQSETTKARFQAYETMKKYINQRINCTERKILVDIYNRFAEDGRVVQDIHLYTVLSPCHECTNLIERFRNHKMSDQSKLYVYDLARIHI